MPLIKTAEHPARGRRVGLLLCTYQLIFAKINLPLHMAIDLEHFIRIGCV